MNFRDSAGGRNGTFCGGGRARGAKITPEYVRPVPEVGVVSKKSAASVAVPSLDNH
jgi:hypothetical protein